MFEIGLVYLNRSVQFCMNLTKLPGDTSEKAIPVGGNGNGKCVTAIPTLHRSTPQEVFDIHLFFQAVHFRPFLTIDQGPVFADQGCRGPCAERGTNFLRLPKVGHLVLCSLKRSGVSEGCRTNGHA